MNECKQRFNQSDELSRQNLRLQDNYNSLMVCYQKMAQDLQQTKMQNLFMLQNQIGEPYNNEQQFNNNNNNGNLGGNGCF
jgi:hypothetical protein